MKILSNKTYRKLKDLKENYNKIVENKINELQERNHIESVMQLEFYNKERCRLCDDFEGRFKMAEKEIEVYKNNIISLKKKINILVKKTK